MDQAKLYLGIIQDIKFTEEVHMFVLAGYCVFAANAYIRHCRGVSLRPPLTTRGTTDAQAERADISGGLRRVTLVYCWVLPIKRIVADISQRPCGASLLVAWDFNTDLTDPEGKSRGEEILLAIVNAGLDNISVPFLPCHKSWVWDSRTWCMCCQGREV